MCSQIAWLVGRRRYHRTIAAAVSAGRNFRPTFAIKVFVTEKCVSCHCHFIAVLISSAQRNGIVDEPSGIVFNFCKWGKFAYNSRIFGFLSVFLECDQGNVTHAEVLIL